MKRLIAIVLMIAVTAPGITVWAEETADVTYMSGTVPGIKEGVAGKLDTTVADDLKFEAGAAEFSIPYAKVTRIEYREQNRFRLGVAATIVVGIVKARHKVHTVTITWNDDKDIANVVTLEMPKARAESLLTVLRARTSRVPSVCEERFHSSCISRN